MVVAIMTFSKNAFIALSIKFRFLSESRLIIIKDKEILFATRERNESTISKLSYY